MIVTTLAIGFLLALSLAAYGGYRILGKRTVSAAEVGTERCSLCRKRFPKEEVIVRQVGDTKLMHFCRHCVLSLYAELGARS